MLTILTLRCVVIVLCFVAYASPAGAQQSGTVTTAAPIFLLPDGNREPLRMAQAGSLLNVLEVTGEWLQVEFKDPQFGPRTGYIQARFVNLPPDRLRPLDLSIEPRSARTAARSTDSIRADRVALELDPQARAPLPSEPVTRKGFLAGVGGITFGTETAPVFGGEFGTSVLPNVQVYGTFGRMNNVMPKDIQDDLDTLSTLLTFSSGDLWSFKAKAPTYYGLGGLRFMPATGSIRPYVNGGLGFGRVNLKVTEIDLGDITDELIDDGYLDRQDVQATKLMYEAGGGVQVPFSGAYVDLGYRFRKMQDVNANISGAYIGFGARF